MADRDALIAQKLAEGKTESQVAAEVGVSDRTVRNAKKRLKATPDEPEADQADEQQAAEKQKPAGPVDAWGIPIQPHAEAAFEALPQFDRVR